MDTNKTIVDLPVKNIWQFKFCSQSNSHFLYVKVDRHDKVTCRVSSNREMEYNYHQITCVNRFFRVFLWRGKHQYWNFSLHKFAREVIITDQKGSKILLLVRYWKMNIRRSSWPSSQLIILPTSERKPHFLQSTKFTIDGRYVIST